MVTFCDRWIISRKMKSERLIPKCSKIVLNWPNSWLSFTILNSQFERIYCVEVGARWKKFDDLVNKVPSSAYTLVAAIPSVLSPGSSAALWNIKYRDCRHSVDEGKGLVRDANLFSFCRYIGQGTTIVPLTSASLLYRSININDKRTNRKKKTVVKRKRNKSLASISRA